MTDRLTPDHFADLFATPLERMTPCALGRLKRDARAARKEEVALELKLETALRVKAQLVEALETTLLETGNAAVYLLQGTTSAISGPLTRIDTAVYAALKAAKETP